ncbi:MAG: hypothetical protein U0556_03570 [Dehalococcoidia bacterium]
MIRRTRCWLLLGILGGLLVVACTPVKKPAEAVASPSCPNGADERQIAPAVHETVYLAFDRSTSYPVQTREQAQGVAANLIADLVRPGPGGVVYISLIGRNSYDPANILEPIVISPTVPPTYSAPPKAPSNPLDRRAGDRYAEARNAWCSEIAERNATYDAALVAVREQANSGAERLRTFKVAHEPASDFGGLMARAAEKFANAPAGGRKTLFIASDMEPYDGQAIALSDLPPLTGVRVMISWHCVTAAICRDLQAAWNQRFAAAGARVQWFTPGEPISHVFD